MAAPEPPRTWDVRGLCLATGLLKDLGWSPPPSGAQSGWGLTTLLCEPVSGPGGIFPRTPQSWPSESRCGWNRREEGPGAAGGARTCVCARAPGLSSPPAVGSLSLPASNSVAIGEAQPRLRSSFPELL